MSTIFDYIEKSEIIVITTDLVDLSIIKELSKYDNKKFYFLVGEGCSIMKYHRMLYYIKLYNIKNAEVLEGYPSKHDDILEGRDIFSEEECIKIRRNVSNINPNKFIGIIKKNPLIISLKPIRELMHVFMTDETIFKDITLIGNIDLSYLSAQYSSDYVDDFLKSFKSVYSYTFINS